MVNQDRFLTSLLASGVEYLYTDAGLKIKFDEL